MINHKITKIVLASLLLTAGIQPLQAGFFDFLGKIEKTPALIVGASFTLASILGYMWWKQPTEQKKPQQQGKSSSTSTVNRIDDSISEVVVPSHIKERYVNSHKKTYSHAFTSAEQTYSPMKQSASKSSASETPIYGPITQEAHRAQVLSGQTQPTPRQISNGRAAVAAAEKAAKDRAAAQKHAVTQQRNKSAKPAEPAISVRPFTADTQEWINRASRNEIFTN
jgi:FtsZ-interacting cell division protein ZipA